MLTPDDPDVRKRRQDDPDVPPEEPDTEPDDGQDEDDDPQDALSWRERLWYRLLDKLQQPRGEDQDAESDSDDSGDSDTEGEVDDRVYDLLPNGDPDLVDPAPRYQAPHGPGSDDRQSPSGWRWPTPEEYVADPEYGDRASGYTWPQETRADQRGHDTGTISRSNPMAVDLTTFAHHFDEQSTPAARAQAFRNASQDAWQRGLQLQERADQMRADARLAQHLPASQHELNVKAAALEEDANGNRRLASHWKSQADAEAAQVA